MFRAGALIIWRDILLTMRRRHGVVTVVFFFVIVASLFPLGVGPEPTLLRTLAPGVVWVAALLACMLSLEHIFSADFRDGTLEQMLLTPQPLSALVFAKIFAHWAVTGLPLTLVAPLLGVQFGLSGGEILVLVAALLLGTPVLSLIGAIGAALTLNVRGGAVLVSVLVLPLYVPVLILGSGAVENKLSGMAFSGHFSFLAAILVLALTFAPFATAASLRIALD
jgi:heme exporter protein B